MLGQQLAACMEFMFAWSVTGGTSQENDFTSSESFATQQCRE
jgi:hypothetical protein